MHYNEKYEKYFNNYHCNNARVPANKYTRYITCQACFVLFQAIIGTVIFLWPKAAQGIRIVYKPFHVFIGITTLILGAGASLLGLFEVIQHR